MGEELGHVDTDPAGADDGDFAADRLAVPHDVDVRQHRRVVDAFDVRHPRDHPGRHDDLVEVFCHQLFGRDPDAQVQLDTGELDAPVEVPDRLGELFLARDATGDVELAADLVGRFEQVDVVPALGQRGRRG